MKRKDQGLPPRAKFSPPNPTDTDYETTGNIELRKPNEEECITKKLELQVRLITKSRCYKNVGVVLLSIFC